MPVITSTDADFKNILSANPKVVVKYYADWCGSCRLLAPKFKRFSDDERFKDIVFLDVNAEENEEARHLANVENLPTFAIFRNGVLVRADALGKEEAILKMIEELAS